MGMSLTERQGGSDVRANETRAEPDGDGYRLNGEKWFCSAPMCDAFLVLAQAPGGLTCFVVPRGDGRGTASTSCGSRTSSGTARTRPPRSSCATRGRRGSARRAAASRRSSRWSCTRGSTACSARRRSCGGRSRRRRTTRRTGSAFGKRADRAAAAPERARGPLPRLRGRDGDCAAARARGGRGRPRVPAARDDGREVPRVQGDAAARRGGARVYRRERLRRGVRAPAALPREPAQLALGGRGERERARSLARGGARAGERRGAARARSSSRRWCGRTAGRRKPSGFARELARRRGRGVPRALGRVARRALPPGVASRPARAARGRGRVLRDPARRRADARTARSRAESTAPRSSSATGPGSPTSLRPVPVEIFYCPT